MIKELKSDILHELETLKKVEGELEETPLDAHRMSRRAVGSILHESYNCCERIFRMIAQDINGVFPVGLDCHKKLLHKMTYEVMEIRPSVISEELASELEEYLDFRHVFRNIYGFELFSNRLERLKEKFNPVFLRFISKIEIFLKKIE